MAISLLAVCQPFTTELASFLAMTGRFVIASLRSNLSFGCLSALHNRDRHVPRDDRTQASAARQSLFSPFAIDRKPRSPRSSRLQLLSLRAQRGNLSFLFVSPSQPRSPRSSRRQVVLSLRACEAISLFAVCQTFTTEIATFLAMTGLRRAQRGNLSFGCLSALHNRDRHVPRDDRTQARSLRSSR